MGVLDTVIGAQSKNGHVAQIAQALCGAFVNGSFRNFIARETADQPSRYRFVKSSSAIRVSVPAADK
jgi:hypothetical protein